MRLEFTETTYSVSEDSGVVEVCLVLLDVAAGETIRANVWADVSTMDGDAEGKR